MKPHFFRYLIYILLIILIPGMTPHMASAADEISGDNGSSGAVVSDSDSDSGDSSSGTDNSVTDDSTTNDSGTTDDSKTDDSGTTDDSKTDDSGTTDDSTTNDSGTTDDSKTDDSGTTDDSKTDDSGTTDDSKTDDSGTTDDSKTDDSGTTDDSKTDDSGTTDDSKTDDSKTDNSKTDDSGTTDDSKTDNSKNEYLNTGDSKTDNSKTDNSKTEDSKTEDSKTGRESSSSNSGSSSIQNPNSSSSSNSGLSSSSTPNSSSSSNSGSSSDSDSGSSNIGSGVSTEPATNIAMKELATRNVISGYHIKYEFLENVTCITYIEYDAERTFRKTTAIVEVLKGKSTLVPKLPFGKIYKHVNIWIGENAAGLPTSLKNGLVGFKVEKKWIENNNVNESLITLQWYDKGWKPLDTEKIGEDEKYVYFESKTPGYSFFAITEYTGEETQLQKTLKTLTGSEQDSIAKEPMKKAKMVLAVSLPLFMVIAGYCVLRKKI